MPTADPSRTLTNPYAHGGEPDTPTGRSARVAGRVLAVGALGLGAVTVLTGTAAAAEGDEPSDTGNEVTSVESDTEEGGGSSGDEPSGGGDSGEEPTEDSTEEPTEERTEDSTEERTEDSTEEPTEDSTEERTQEPTAERTEEPAEDSTEEPTGTGGRDGSSVPAELLVAQVEDGDEPRTTSAPAGTDGEPTTAVEETPESDDDAEPVEESGTEVEGEVLLAAADDGGEGAAAPRLDVQASEQFRVQDDGWAEAVASGDVRFVPGPAFEEFTGGDDDRFAAARDLADLFAGGGTVGIEGLGTVEIAPPAERTRDGEGRGSASDLPEFALSQAVRDAIDTRLARQDAGSDGRVDVTVGTPRPVQVAPGVTITGPRVGTGSARLDVDLGQRRLGVTGLTSDVGRITAQRSGTLPLDDGGESRVQGSTSTTVTLDPRTGRSVHLSGAPATGDRAGTPGGVTIRTTNQGTVSTGTLPPATRPTGDTGARWGAVGAGLGLNGDLALTNTEGSVVPSGSVAAPLSVFTTSGEDLPGRRWGLNGTATLTPQFATGNTGSQVTADVTGRVGGEIGDRRTSGGVFPGSGAGAVVSGGLFGQYTATDSGVVTVPGTTRQVEADTTRYRVGGDLGFEAREVQPTWGAGVEGSVSAGVSGSSVTTATGSSSTGATPFLNARLTGDAEIATAPRGEARATLGVDGSARYDLENGRSSSALQLTPRIGGSVPLGGTTTLDGSLGYQFGVTTDATNGTRDDSGIVGRVGTGFDLAGGRTQLGVKYDGADPGGGESVAVELGFTPGAARGTPRPTEVPAPVVPTTPAGDLPRFDQDAAGLGSAGAPVLTPFPGLDTAAPVTPAVTPAVTPPGPVVGDASALSGTTPVGIDLVPAQPVVSPDPGAPAGAPLLGVSVNEPVIPLPPVEPALQSTAPVDTGAEALAVALDRPVVDLPAATAPVEPAAGALEVSLTEPVIAIPTVPAPTPVEVASITPVPLPEPVPLPAPQPEPVPTPEPVLGPLPEPGLLSEPLADLVASPAFSMDDITGFDTTTSMPSDTFSLADTSFLDTGSFGFSGGGFF